jgi:hypothetical protein
VDTGRSILQYFLIIRNLSQGKVILLAGFVNSSCGPRTTRAAVEPRRWTTSGARLERDRRARAALVFTGAYALTDAEWSRSTARGTRFLVADDRARLRGQLLRRVRLHTRLEIRRILPSERFSGGAIVALFGTRFVKGWTLAPPRPWARLLFAGCAQFDFFGSRFLGVVLIDYLISGPSPIHPRYCRKPANHCLGGDSLFARAFLRVIPWPAPAR